MKKIVFRIIFSGFFISGFMACGVKGRPEPPLRSQPEPAVQVAEPKPPVTFATDKPVAKPKSANKKKNGN